MVLRKSGEPSAKATEDQFDYIQNRLRQLKDRECQPLRLQDPLRVGTDCSGMGSELIALKALGVHDRCKPTFWCKKCGKKQSLYKDVCSMAGFDLGRLHNDITLRDHETLEDIDLYMSGFPCQLLSALGKRLGTADARGHIGFHCCHCEAASHQHL